MLTQPECKKECMLQELVMVSDVVSDCLAFLSRVLWIEIHRMLFPVQILRAQLELKRLPPSDFLGAWHVVSLQGHCNDFAQVLPV